MSTVEVLYRCECMRKRASLQVPERAPALDVVMWIEDVAMPRVAADHRRRHPQCRETKMKETLFPAPPDGIIGGQRGVS